MMIMGKAKLHGLILMILRVVIKYYILKKFLNIFNLTIIVLVILEMNIKIVCMISNSKEDHFCIRIYQFKIAKVFK